MSKHDVLTGRGRSDPMDAVRRYIDNRAWEQEAARGVRLRDYTEDNYRRFNARRIQRAWRRYDGWGPSANYIAQNPREYTPSDYRPFGYHVEGVHSNRRVRARIRNGVDDDYSLTFQDDRRRRRR